MSQHQVMYHAFSEDEDGNQHYTDVESETKGWCAYVRTEPDAGGKFDIPEERNVDTLEEAIAAADELAAKYNTTIIERY